MSEIFEKLKNQLKERLELNRPIERWDKVAYSFLDSLQGKWEIRVKLGEWYKQYTNENLLIRGILRDYKALSTQSQHTVLCEIEKINREIDKKGLSNILKEIDED